MKNQLKKYGSLFVFIFLFPYICSILLNKMEHQEIKSEKKGEYKVVLNVNAGAFTMPLEKYLVGVLATVIPIEYEEEALKAQAIILRTDIIKQYLEKGNGNRLIVAETLGYEYWDSSSLKLLWKDKFEENQKKLQMAVSGTEDMVLTYQGIPMEVPFFAVSAGNTRNGSEVFQNQNYPYLKSVNCSKDIVAQNYRERLFFSKEEINKTLEKEILSLEEIKIKKTDTNGYVLEIEVGGDVLVGEEFRKQLALASSHFTIEILEEKMCITTNGIGHGLGLSQYSANQMALEKKTFLEILTYFYLEAQIKKQ